jgi:peptidoglycan hydrolase-like protein with peptidoglycan-binding domain
VEQWFQNTRGLVIVVLAVITAVVLLAIEPGGGFPTAVSASSGGETPTASTTVTTTVPGATTTTVARPTISQGTPDTASTTVLQTRLLQLGYSGVGKADGNFGPATTTAVKQFQTDRGLPSTGTVDQATWNALSATPPATTTTTAAK